MKFILAFLFLISMTTFAFAHSWYENECCGGYDCGRITKMTVLPNGDLDITIHVMLEKNAAGDVKEYDLQAIFPADFEQRPSQDGDNHACIVRQPDTGAWNKPRCLYLGAGY